MIEDHRNKFTSQIRENLWAIVKILYNSKDYTSLYDASSRLGIEKERARQAFKSGKGTEVLLGLILDYYGFQVSEIRKNLPKLRKMMTKAGELTVAEELIEEVRGRLSENEVIAELRTIIARDEIRAELGLKNRAGRPKNKS